jgi:hypothetical protein
VHLCGEDFGTAVAERYNTAVTGWLPELLPEHVRSQIIPEQKIHGLLRIFSNCARNHTLKSCKSHMLPNENSSRKYNIVYTSVDR